MSTAQQALFEREYLPVLTSRCAFRFRHLAAEARAEATQDCIAKAWNDFLDAGDKAWDGQEPRTGKATPNRLADFIIAGYQTSGRGSLGQDVLDVLSPGTQKLGRVTISHISCRRYDEDAAPQTQLLAKESVNPASRFRAKEDWRTIGQALRPQAREVLTMIIEGRGTGEIANRIGVSAPRVSMIKTEIGRMVKAHGYGYGYAA